MMPGAHWHFAYGLVLRSELALPTRAAKPTAKPPDVEITLGDALPEDADTTLLHAPGVGLLAVRGGSEIRIRPDPGTEPNDMALYVLGSGLGRVLQQRGAHLLHGAALRGEGATALVLGPSGAGKSTLAAHLAARGFDALCDDMIALKAESGGFRIIPSGGVFKLWDDALRDLGHGIEGLRPVARRTGKYYAPLGVPGGTACARPDVVLVCERGDGVGEPGLEALGPLAALQALDEHSYGAALLSPSERARHFQALADLTAQARIARLRRPWGTAHLAATVDLVARLLDGTAELAPAR